MSPAPMSTPGPNYVPRHQRYLFWALAVGILLALAAILHGCRTAEKRLATPQDATPIAAPAASGTETGSPAVDLYLASDADGSVTVTPRPLALPAEPTTRARSLLEQLLLTYTLPNSPHPLPTGPAVDDVFLLTLPLAPPLSEPAKKSTKTAQKRQQLDEIAPVYGSSGELAVINLHGAFADQHPSGVEVEALTLASIIGTLHANMPQISLIRFLVDGRPRDTLAGHADLTRTYPSTDTAYHP